MASVTKAQAYGNDFLLLEEDAIGPGVAGRDPAIAVRELCDRHRGIGADGVIIFRERPGGAAMRLFNADGGGSELSGNGLRCLAALLTRRQHVESGATIEIDTDAGRKTLELLGHEGARCTFRAAMGPPEALRQVDIAVGGESLTASVMRMGNPQCVVLGPLPAPARFNHLGPALATHPMFPAGTNVEFAQIDAPDRVRILIWERGVGPTTSSGTGTSASGVAAAAHGGAARAMDVIAPGGSQRVEWESDGVYLTGWAELVLEGNWLGHGPKTGRADG